MCQHFLELMYFKYILELHMDYRNKVDRAGILKVPERLILYHGKLDRTSLRRGEGLIVHKDGVSEGQFQQVLDGGEHQGYEFI